MLPHLWDMERKPAAQCCRVHPSSRQARYCERHDQVLRKLAEVLEEKRAEIKKSQSLQKQEVTFITEEVKQLLDRNIYTVCLKQQWRSLLT